MAGVYAPQTLAAPPHANLRAGRPASNNTVMTTSCRRHPHSTAGQQLNHSLPELDAVAAAQALKDLPRLRPAE